MNSYKPHQNGVALFQALLLAMIFSLLAINVTKTANWQVESAQGISDKVLAMLAVKSSHNRLTYELATKPPNLITSFNYHGRIFEYHGTRVEIQDLNGLISIPQQQTSNLLEKLLDFHQLPEATDQAQELVRKEGVAPLMSSSELLNKIRGDKKAKETFSRDITFNINSGFNPLVGTLGTLTAYTSREIAQDIIEARNTGQLSESRVVTMTGLYPDEMIQYSIGPYYRIRVTAERGDSFVRTEKTVYINPTDEQNVIRVLERRPDF